MFEQARHALRDREAESEALVARAAAAAEFLEDRCGLGFGDAGAGVPDFDAQLRSRAPAAEQDAARFDVAQRIGKKVLQHAAQQVRVRTHPCARRHVAQLQTLFACERAKLGGERAE